MPTIHILYKTKGGNEFQIQNLHPRQTIQAGLFQFLKHISAINSHQEIKTR